MNEVSQASAKDEAHTSAAVEHHVMDILNPTLHHHDLLQSYVRIRTETGSDSKKDQEEFEEPSKDTHPGKYATLADSGDGNARKSNARNVHDKRKKSNDKKEKDRLDIATLESEMRIQKTRRKWRQQDDCHRQEEVYTDKDRAAAVNMGTTDIKQSLKLKQRQDRSKSLQIPEETEPGALLTLGLREMRFGDVNVAVNCINKVHELWWFF